MTTTPAPRDERSDYEKWLQEVHLLSSKLDPERNCFADFPAHLAHQAWEARAAIAESELAEVRHQNELATHELESLRGHHDACIQDAYQKLSIDGSDGELRYKWVALELSGIVRERDELRAKLERVKKDSERLDLIEKNPGWLRNHKGKWSFTSQFTNYAYSVFPTARAAIDASRDGKGEVMTKTVPTELDLLQDLMALIDHNIKFDSHPAKRLREVLAAPVVDGAAERKAAFDACPESGCDWGSFWQGWMAKAKLRT